MTQDDVLFGYRLQLLPRRSERWCRRPVGCSGFTARPTMGGKRQVDRHGLEMLRPRERRRPKMPTTTTAPTTDASHKDRSPQTLSTVPTR
jgi:hypothetical protein